MYLQRALWTGDEDLLSGKYEERTYSKRQPFRTVSMDCISPPQDVRHLWSKGWGCGCLRSEPRASESSLAWQGMTIGRGQPTATSEASLIDD